MKQLTREQAIKFYESKEYESWPPKMVVLFQLQQKLWCIDLTYMQRATEYVLKRSVYIHEFANRNLLLNEALKDKDPPTLNEILDLIPNKNKILAIIG